MRVSPTGLLTARTVRSNVRVIAELTYQGVRLADTAVITVTSVTQPSLGAQLVLQPLVAGDTAFPTPTFSSALYGVPAFKQLRVQVLDSSGTLIPEALLALSTSAASGSATFQRSVLTSGTARLNFNPDLSRPGVLRVYGSATVYGVTLYDTLTLVLTNPRLELLQLRGATITGATPGSTQTVYTVVPAGAVPLAVGGTVWWWNTTSDSVDVVFDDPSAAVADGTFPSGDGDGNIVPYAGCPGFFECDNLLTRQFPHAGTFPWHSSKTGLVGTIVVQ